MTSRGLAAAVSAAVLCVVAGCGEETSDERLVEIAVKLEKQQQAVDRLTAKIEEIEKRLEEIEKSRENVSASPGPPKATPEDTRKPPGPARNLSGILKQLNVNPNLLAGAKENLMEYAEQLVARAAAWRAMGEPEELSRKLDILVENFSAEVGNPTLREKLAGDVERLKMRFLAPITPEQQREQARQITLEAIGVMSNDDTSRQWLETQLKALDEATNPLEVAARVNVTLELWKAWEVSQLAQRNNVLPEMMEESGLTLSTEAADYIPAEVTERLGVTPSPVPRPF